MTAGRDRPAVGGAGGDTDAEEIARLIYDEVFLPGKEVDGGVMPPFEEARALRTGGYERAVAAARRVASRIRRPKRP